MAEMFVQNAAIFKKPLPEIELSVNTGPIDMRARWDMMVKVVDLKLQELSEFYRLLGQSVGEVESPQTVTLDVANRYVTSRSRTRTCGRVVLAFGWRKGFEAAARAR